jgi:phosphoglycerate kinase
VEAILNVTFGRVEEYSLKHILKTTSDVLGKAVEFVSDCIGEEAKNAAAKLQAGEVYCWKTYVFMRKRQGCCFCKKLASLEYLCK